MSKSLHNPHSPIASCIRANLSAIPPRMPTQTHQYEQETEDLFSPPPRLTHDFDNNYMNNHESDDSEEDMVRTDAMLSYTAPDFDSSVSEFDPYTFIKHLPPYETVLRHGRLSTVLPPLPNTFTHTLVLDLDETLVHCSVEPISQPDYKIPVTFEGQNFTVFVKIRPIFQHFMEQVSRVFEIVVFTASQRVYAEKLLDTLDPMHLQIQYFHSYHSHRLYRDSCIYVNGNYMKDLNVLGRDLSKCIIVDNSPHAFGYQLDNGIPIETWFDNPNDTELLTLLPFLLKISRSDNVQTEIRQRFRLHQLVANSV